MEPTAGGILKDLMACNDISQRQLAKEIGVSNGTISRIVNDKVVPTGRVLIKIADYFGVTVGYLMGKEE